MTDLPEGYYWLRVDGGAEFIGWVKDRAWRLDPWSGIWTPLSDLVVLNPQDGPLRPRAVTAPPESAAPAPPAAPELPRAVEHAGIERLAAAVASLAEKKALFGLAVAMITTDLRIRHSTAAHEDAMSDLLAATTLLQAHTLAQVQMRHTVLAFDVPQEKANDP